MQRPAEADQEPGERTSRRQPEQPAVGEPGNPSLDPTPAAPGTQEEEGLPAERVEEPHLVRPWIGRQRDTLVELDRAPEPEGGGKHARRPEPEPNQHEGEHGEQHNVERQDVHELRLELQGQRLDHRQTWLLEKVGGAELLGVDRVIEGIDQVRHRRHELHEQKDMGDVELPHPVIDAHPGPQQALTLDRAPVHHPGSVARDQDEHLGRVGESHRLEGELRQEAVPVDMVDKDAKEGKAAKEIEPKVAL